MRLTALLLLLSFPALADYGPYPADLVRVLDGDTIELDIRLWPGLTKRVKLRLDGVNAPESRTRRKCEKEAAKKAKAFVVRFVTGPVIVTGVRNGKYAGRVLGRVSVNGKDLGAALLKAGHAREYHGGRRGAWC